MTSSASLKTRLEAGSLMPAALANLHVWLDAGLPEWALASIEELIAGGHWAELNDRFYRDLEFGTGGMRGRTIGRVSTAAERGQVGPQGTPEHAAIGSNILNDYTLVRATVGLFRHTASYLAAKGDARPPSIVIAHDVRHFSRHFCELAASTWSSLGGQAFIFDGPRSTPQLSFTVRHLGASCGVVITASHNPPHDNGFKAYFDDGAQVVAPHDKGIVNEVGRVALAELPGFFRKDLSRVVVLGQAADAAYRAAAATAVIDPTVFKAAGLKVAFTSIHGVGNIMSVPLLRATGVELHEEPAQAVHDPRFPTVKSPNPENAEALALAVKLAEEKGLDLVMATDPDCDRMGAAVRGRDGKMHLLTGNQIGALLTEYRISRYKETGVIPKGGTDRAALVKTFVTTALQDEIARSHGVKVVNTLTGFKWIAAKIRSYEDRLKAGYLAARLQRDALCQPRPAAPGVFDLLSFWHRGELWLPGQRLGARQGRQLRLSDAGRSVRPREEPRPHRARVSGRDLSAHRLLPRRGDQSLLRRRERSGQDQAHPRHLPGGAAAGLWRRRGHQV